MRVLFVRPPRYMWPWNSESSSFWQPLGFASIASVLRDNDFDVEILDCLPNKIGWKSLRKKLEQKSFDVVCVGDETASAEESIKVASFVKEIKPDVKIIAGGYFFPYMEEHSLNDWGMDYLVRGEGEQTILELLSWLSGKKEIKNYSIDKKYIQAQSVDEIKGLIYKSADGKIHVNKERQPIDMNELPIPAYDLLHMDKYGKESKNHRDFGAIEHGRGCLGNCDFCSINALYSYNNKSCYRTKSAAKSFEETEILVKKYKRKTLNWADGTFNHDNKWSKEYFGLLETSNLKFDHTAWMRADCIIRDEKNGVMKKMVDNGLRQAIVGMERLDSSDNKRLNAHNKEYEICIDAFKILRKYKKVYTIATLIYGLPDDSYKELNEIKKFIYKNVVDFQFILPFTPYPGTRIWDKYKKNFTLDDFKSWNLHRPVMGTKHLTREQLDRWFKECLLSYMFHPNFYVRNLLETDSRKRKVHWSLTGKLFKGLYRGVKDNILGTKELEYGRKPDWYNS